MSIRYYFISCPTPCVILQPVFFQHILDTGFLSNTHALFIITGMYAGSRRLQYRGAPRMRNKFLFTAVEFLT